jgi:thiol-disulfide isomerase/thioredoxin
MYWIPLVVIPFLSTDSTPIAEELAQLAKDGTAIETNFYEELKKAGRDMPLVRAANDKYRVDTSAWAERANSLLKGHPAEPETLDVILTMNEIHYVDDETVAILREHHFRSPKVLELMQSFAQDSEGPRRSFAEDVAEQHEDISVRGKATLALGRMDRIYLIDGLKDKPSFGGRLGKPEALRERARLYLERVLKEYSGIESDEEDTTLGELARDELAGLDNAGRLHVGNPAPDIEAEDLDGKPLKLNFRGGKVTLLVFWGTWCGPCMRLIPQELAMSEKYKDRPFQLYGINGGDERDVAKASVLKKQITWPNFYSGKARSGLAAIWNVDAWPAVYVIGPDGVIRYKGNGGGLEEAVEKAVTEAETQN